MIRRIATTTHTALENPRTVDMMKTVHLEQAHTEATPLRFPGAEPIHTGHHRRISRSDEMRPTPSMYHALTTAIVHQEPRDMAKSEHRAMVARDKAHEDVAATGVAEDILRRPQKDLSCKPTALQLRN